VKKYFTIIEEGVTIGFFTNPEDRDNAFEEHFMNTDRFGVKGEK